LEDNSAQVLNLLVSYAQSSSKSCYTTVIKSPDRPPLAQAAHNPRLYECIASWLREIPTLDVLNSPLLNEIMDALQDSDSFEAAVDCLSTMFRDTRDIDESQSAIRILYPRVVKLRPMIAEAAKTEDNDLMKGITRLFAEAGEAWVILIARMPGDFRELVECVLECCLRDKDRDAIAVTFMFWYELKQILTLEKYMPARAALADLFSKLVDVMIKHLEFPTPENGDEKDLFDGDREAEDKFRSFRHSMGDVLKDCCEVIGVTQCLTKAFALIQSWGQTYGPQVSGTTVPHWQELEAPLFSLRAMGRMVSPEESTVLPQFIPLLTSVPDHEKLKFQAIMALARYTEWTAQHPETLEAQLNYVISGFGHPSQEVVQASALAFKFLGTDCQKLLGDHISQLHQFYESVIDKLKPASQEEVTEGVAAVVAVQPVNKIYESMKLFIDPVMRRVVSLASQATDENAEKTVADYLQLVNIFFEWVQPYVSPSDENPAVRYCQEILPALSQIAKHFTRSMPILERVCKCWRTMVVSYRTATAPLLPTLATNIAEGFEASRQGCFLWATDAVIREFSYGAEFVDEATSDNVYQFFAQQATVFFRILSELQPVELPDVIEDFFRLASDAVRFYPRKTITSNLALPMVQASLTALTLTLLEPIQATLHFLRDFLDFGFERPPVSNFSGPDGEPAPGNSLEVRTAVRQVINSVGQELVHRVLTGMMFSFPEDCFPDASGVLLSLFNLGPQAAAQWVQGTLQALPPGTLKPAEASKLMRGIGDKLQQNEPRKVRVLLQDFTNSYRRRNVAPREGLGRLEAARFKFSG
jgi:transportin-3